MSCWWHFGPRLLTLGSSNNCSSALFPPTSGYVKLPPEKFTPKKQGSGGGKDLPTEAKKLQLNSAEELYAEIRDKNFNAVGSVLSKKAKIISAAFEVRRALAATLPSESDEETVVLVTMGAFAAQTSTYLRCLGL